MDIEYEVQRIIGKKKIKGKIHYLVKWSCCLACESTWEPEENLFNCYRLVNRYNNPQLQGRTKKKADGVMDIPGTVVPEEMDASEEEFEVERIVARRIKNGITEFYVKWKGYPSSQNSWEPVAHLKNAPLRVKEYTQNLRLFPATRSIVRQESMMNGFERGLMPEKIVCLITSDQNKYFLIQFLFEENMDIVSEEQAKKCVPLMVEEFFEKIKN